MHLVFDPAAPTIQSTNSGLLEHVAMAFSNVLRAVFQCVAATLNVLRPSTALERHTLSDVLQRMASRQCVAAKAVLRQRLVRVRHSATHLFLLSIKYTHTRTCTYAYRGNIGRGFEVLHLWRSRAVS